MKNSGTNHKTIVNFIFFVDNPSSTSRWHKVGSTLAYSWLNVGIQLAQRWHTVGSTLAYSWLNVGIQLAQRCHPRLDNGTDWHSFLRLPIQQFPNVSPTELLTVGPTKIYI
ncbi:hypothetical protein AVEN_206406-1 [Araneus ventricosus]|uniref:Uncharacterized protein n=1 Tax=Araneus ventricosus TaxID=182803 RepID=A0A4Y2EM03_ARAVE|nr:hypothetical protein AVEN_206406-1 [Araneus ventricosus]